MRVLALYDIHGNVDALDAVLADPRAADPDVVLVGGDAVPGPFARETLARLDALSVPVRWVRGNGEREVGEAVGAPAPAPDDLAARTAASSPPPCSATSGRAHSAGCRSPWSSTACSSATPPPAGTTRSSPGSRPRSAGRRRWAVPQRGWSWLVTRTSRTIASSATVRFVNAGSVGLPYEGDGAARWLWVADGEPALRQTAYDAAGAGARMLQAGWPDEQSVAAALVDPVEPIIVTRFFEEL